MRLLCFLPCACWLPRLVVQPDGVCVALRPSGLLELCCVQRARLCREFYVIQAVRFLACYLVGYSPVLGHVAEIGYVYQLFNRNRLSQDYESKRFPCQDARMGLGATRVGRVKLLGSVFLVCYRPLARPARAWLLRSSCVPAAWTGTCACARSHHRFAVGDAAAKQIACRAADSK